MAEEANRLSVLSKDDVDAQRRCVCCAESYSITDFLSSDNYFTEPYNYVQGCVTHCLGCWLGTGPDEKRELGNVLFDLSSRLSPTVHLVLMPLIRVHTESPICLGGVAFLYPPGVDTSGMNIPDPDRNSRKLNERLTALSGVDLRTIRQHHTIAFPAEFHWDSWIKTGHEAQMRFLRSLSRTVDVRWLNSIRYRFCRLDRADFLPGRAGQLHSNPMMAGAVIYNPGRQQGHVVGGSAFTHLIVKGLGLDVEELPSNDFALGGEVGLIVRRGLDLYRTALEADDESTKFMQAVALLDFLAEPSDYVKSKEIAKRIVPYIATNREEYERLQVRFAELYGKHDGGHFSGIRTRIVHLGESLEDVLPNSEERASLFRELARYLGKVFDHMITHSSLSWDEYVIRRRSLGPFGMTPRRTS